MTSIFYYNHVQNLLYIYGSIEAVKETENKIKESAITGVMLVSICVIHIQLNE